jgi:hypothetical protein
LVAMPETTKVTPVTLPPGLLRLATRPSSTGSPPMVNTIGMAAVAALAASPEASPPVAAITATSAASAGSRSYRPSAQRYSRVTSFACRIANLAQGLTESAHRGRCLARRSAAEEADHRHRRLLRARRERPRRRRATK